MCHCAASIIFPFSMRIISLSLARKQYCYHWCRQCHIDAIDPTVNICTICELDTVSEPATDCAEPTPHG